MKTIAEIERRTNRIDKLLSDVLVTAVEGGINYWAVVTEYKPDNGYVSFREDENDSGVKVRCTKNSDGDYVMRSQILIFGLMKLDGMSDWLELLNYTSAEEFDEMVDDLDLDAGDADSIFQLAVFGEIVYG